MNDAEFYDLEEIKHALAGRIDEFVLTYFPNAKKHQTCYRIGNINGDSGDSMVISTRLNDIGSFRDYADDTCYGKPWRLVAIKRGCSHHDAIVWLANFLNVQPIQSFGNLSKSKDPERLAREIKPLTQRSIEYAASRRISEETLRKYGVGSGVRDDTIFPYYDYTGKLGMVKHWGHTPKENGKKNTWTNDGPVISLFGKDVCDPEGDIQKLVITEGEWDAMACYEAGIPAVSIPMGVSNHQWITEDYQYLSNFDEIVLLFDNDQPGRKAAEEVASRLGKERCLIVTLPLKDANDMLKANRGREIATIIATTMPEPIAEIVDPDSMKEQVRSFMRRDHLVSGDGFFLPDFDLNFREHEITLWFGYTFHGKSITLANQIGSLACRGIPTCVASFEQQPEMTFSQILEIIATRPNLPYEEDFDKAFEWASQIVFMYKSMKRADPRHLIQTFIHAHKRYGIKVFVIDNVMTLDVDRGDNTQQAEAADLIRMFAADYPVHVHIVAHPRKAPESTVKPPGTNEIRGAAEWGDIPHNIICVWRDMAKMERMSEMEETGYSQDDIRRFWESTPDGKLLVRKQRISGKTPMANFWFHEETKRITRNPKPPTPMYSEYPWKTN